MNITRKGQSAYLPTPKGEDFSPTFGDDDVPDIRNGKIIVEAVTR